MTKRYAIEHNTAWIAVPQKHHLDDVWLLTDARRTKQFVARGADINFVSLVEAEAYITN